MGFTKLDERIIRSSIMAEPPEVFKVWIALLAACGEDGVAELSPTYLARVCYLEQDVVVNALDKLAAPDPLSRSTEHEGRRIERVDGGYKVLNYLTYRQYSLRGAEAERKRLYRAEKKASESVQSCPDISGQQQNCPDASASASSSDSFFDLWWKQYPRKLGKQDAKKAYESNIKEGSTHEEMETALKAYCCELARLGTEEKFVKHPATFLRAERWRDYLCMPTEKPKKIGENNGPTKPKDYWDKVRELKEQGLTGEDLLMELKTWEEGKKE